MQEKIKIKSKIVLGVDGSTNILSVEINPSAYDGRSVLIGDGDDVIYVASDQVRLLICALLEAL